MLISPPSSSTAVAAPSRGLAYFVARFEPENADEAVTTVMRSLAYLGDIEDDPAIAISVEELQGYWSGRVPEIAAHISRHGYGYSGSLRGAQSDAVVLAKVKALAPASSTDDVALIAR